MNKLMMTACLIWLIIPLQAQNAREISDRAAGAIEVKSMEMDANLLIVDAKGRERSRSLNTKTATFGDVSKTMLHFTEPADVRGTALLIYDYEDKPDDMWIFLPALRKTRRILSSEKGKSFMGSEFTNADMALPNADDFTYKILGEESINGKACWKIESSCKTDEVALENGYLKKISWIDKEAYLCYKVEFYTAENELFKVQTIGDYRKDSGGKMFAWFMEMSNLENSRKSLMTVENYQSGVTLKEDSFTPVMLER